MTREGKSGRQGFQEDLAMRMAVRKALRTGFAAGFALILAASCKDSNTVAGVEGSPQAAASLTGTWTGTFQSDSGTCGSSPVSVTLQQTGADFAGTFKATPCGPNGAFRGRVAGNRITGSVNMLGCTGGGVAGEMGASGLSLQVGDLYRPLVTGNAVVMPGGTATLRR
jgi:hypothetical protein